jgi:amino acid transporter
MARSNKFGTFGGVFTPSILTILGVIMFMRLPMIIGEAGLWATLGIIAVAHIISITTGLSVSSIATDKKVKAGGTYYIISRSLGLPIGGTLGLALFVGLSFSVSLYLIGFAESFLGFWGFPINIDNIRLAGSIILLTVTVITFISTSLAIKTQYLIMTAIFLSLLSIFFGSHEFAPTEPHFFGKGSTVPLMVLFGIFFPAVTGFEAGVSMSGDLKDPKKSIPGGTIAAIAIGLTVYIGLAFFFSYTVQGDVLANDPKVLLKISLVPQLVVAGIWGATLSSALGSILAAPRILQATAIDKIAPKFFAKGTVSANEPRNALLLTFLIAEVGIMIGDLNVIARVVSIFFITTYGFLNLSAAFENATSADFRPSFRIPVWVSLIGATACFLVMIQLDFIALIGATIILGLLFLFIKRKQLSLEGGDAWSSVWASLIKSGIKRLMDRQVHGRNWRPNIIMFAGAEKERPQLVDLGNSLAGTLGMITGFELEVIDDTSIVKDHSRITREVSGKKLVFHKHRCTDVYIGMDEIVRVYGFTGVEPNTVFMGWAGRKDRRERFERLIKIFEKNDISAIFLNHDHKRGFGQYTSIDIWVRGSDRDLAFAINIIRHLKSSVDWKDAQVRLLVAINHRVHIEKAYKTLEETINRFRVTMDIKVINNSIDAYAWDDIVRKESAETDLTIMGVSDILQGRFEKVYDQVNSLKQSLGSLLLIKAGSQFEEIDLGIDEAHQASQYVLESTVALPDLVLTKHQAVNDDIAKIDANGQQVLERLYAKTFIPCYSETLNFFIELKSLIGNIAEDLDKVFKYEDLHRRNRTVVRTKNEFYYHTKRILEKLLNEKLATQKTALEDGISWYIEKLDQDILKFPHHLTLHHEKREFRIKKADHAALRWYKTRKQIFHPFARTTIPVKVNYKTIAEIYLRSTRYFFLHAFLNKFKSDLETVFSHLRPLLIAVDEQLEVIERKINAKDFSKVEVQEFENSLTGDIARVEADITRLEELNRNRLAVEYRKNLQRLTHDLEGIDVNRHVSKMRKGKNIHKSLLAKISSFAESWHEDSSNYLYKIYLDVLMLSYKNIIKDKLAEFETVFLQEIDTGPIKKLAEIYIKFDQIDEDLSGIQGSKISISSSEEYPHIFSEFEKITSEFREFENKLPESLTLAELPVAGNKRENRDNAELINLPLRNLTGYVLETKFIGSANDLLGTTLETLRSSIYHINELLSLTRFNLENINSETEDRSGLILQIRAETIDKLSREEVKIRGLKVELLPSMNKLLEDTFDSLSSHKIKDIYEKYSRFSLDNRGKAVRYRFNLSYLAISNLIKRKTARLVYSKSEGILFAKKLITYNGQSSDNEKILDLIDKVVPRPEVIKALPHYYKNLFSGRSSIGEDFWISRTVELGQFDKAIKRFQAGVKGGIMLLGERNAGKTALCRHVSMNRFDEDKVHHIFPLPGGSVSREEFNAQLQKSTKLSVGINEMFDTLPYGSVIVIHDLELWWQRSEDGFDIIELILDLIGQFDYKCLFIINMNPFAYELINKIYQMEQHFISIIHCQPFKSEELKEMVMRRHRSSGLKFRIEKKKEENISEIALARLFNRYFDQSDGNPGTVLYQWLGNIEKVSAGNIYIKQPKNIDLQPIENLDDNSMVVLVQLALHKRIPFGRLEKVLGIESNITEEIVNSLIRTGVIEERPERVLLINPYIEPYVRKVFKRKRLL